MRHAHRSRPRAAGAGGGACLAAALAALLLGCGKGEKTYEVTDVRTRPDAGPAAPEASTGERFGARSGDASEGAHGGGGPSWDYKTPEGWAEITPGDKRELAWRVAGNADAECSFSMLSGSGGGLLANVNRWRQQMSVGATDEATVAALPKKTFFGRPATYVEQTGVFKGMGGAKILSGAKLVGLIASMPMATLFLKMTGPAAVVDAETAHFFALAASLKMGAGGGAPATAPPSVPAPAGPGADGSASGLGWTVPATWKKNEQASGMGRLVTFVPEGAPHAEAYVSVFGGTVGGPRANVDRWRGQLGLAPATDEEFAKLPRKKILGAEALFVTIEGSPAGSPGSMLLAMLVPHGDGTVFVKMTGPASEVRGEAARFQAFCESLHE